MPAKTLAAPCPTNNRLRTRDLTRRRCRTALNWCVRCKIAWHDQLSEGRSICRLPALRTSIADRIAKALPGTLCGIDLGARLTAYPVQLVEVAKPTHISGVVGRDIARRGIYASHRGGRIKAARIDHRGNR